MIILKIVPLLTVLLLWVQTDQVQDTMVVSQAVRGWGDAIRLYVLPAAAVFFAGVAAALVEWIRRILKNQAERMRKEGEAKADRDRALQITLDETNARTLVASANAEVAARRAELLGINVEEQGRKQGDQLTNIEHSVNSAAEKAQRQIEMLTKQLQEANIRPEKGNGPEGGGRDIPP